MAAYAALRSLTTTLNNIQIHPRVSTFFDNQQIQSLHQIINFLLHFMETRTSHGRNREEDEVLEKQIACTTHKVEDVIESHLVHQILPDAGHENKLCCLIGSLTSLVINCVRPTEDDEQFAADCLRDLENEIQDMNSLKEMVMQQFQAGTIDFQDEYSFSPAPSSNSSFLVGFDERVIQIMERLTGHQTGLQIIPIVGMGGIGKTTLAKSVYDHLHIVESFDIRAWVTVSREYSLKSLLSQLMSCIKRSKGAVHFESDLESEDPQLGLKVYQALSCRTYLIVLDDMWSIEVWYRIKNFFPINSDERSRVVITTRMSSVAIPLSSSSFEMDFLDEDQSWKLFCRNVFLEKGCPPELENIGKDIVRVCKGLPLSIIVIGGLLRQYSRSTSEYWENIAKDLINSGNDGYNCLNILSLSYNHLPAHLKPCFLYMGVFREDEEIRVSRLINLLVAEGFLKPKEGRTMEEVATDYLNDLVDRNLILADRWRWDGRIKNCKMHDLVREVCLKICEREQIFHKMSQHEFGASINGVRRIVFGGNRIPSKCPPASLVRTFLSESSSSSKLEFRLLRVLSVARRCSSEVFFQHVNLRYLVCCSWGGKAKLPSSVSLLWNVHTLIFTEYELKAPSEIWYMRQLRHLQSNRLYLPDPPLSEDELALLPNLHTLSKVVNLSFTEEVCKRIFPNMKKLGIIYRSEECDEKKLIYFNLDHLRELQSLYFEFAVPQRDEFLESLRLPSLLRKLCLHNCGVHWEDINTFGLSLPHLQVLKLSWIVGEEWDCVEGAFPSLKVLVIIGCEDLIKWTSAESNSDCFPVLHKLELYGLHILERIPSELIQTLLGSIIVSGCSLSATISAVEILDEQLHFGNDNFHLQIISNDRESKERLMEEVDINSFTPNNLECIAFS